jgi:hypothetical protein
MDYFSGSYLQQESKKLMMATSIAERIRKSRVFLVVRRSCDQFSFGCQTPGDRSLPLNVAVNPNWRMKKIRQTLNYWTLQILLWQMWMGGRGVKRGDLVAVAMQGDSWHAKTSIYPPV